MHPLATPNPMLMCMTNLSAIDLIKKTLKMVSRTGNTITTLSLGGKGVRIQIIRPLEMSVYLSNTGISLFPFSVR